MVFITAIENKVKHPLRANLGKLQFCYRLAAGRWAVNSHRSSKINKQTNKKKKKESKKENPANTHKPAMVCGEPVSHELAAETRSPSRDSPKHCAPTD